ncbi:outer membrane beta-barrel protein [Thalassotalea piscium]
MLHLICKFFILLLSLVAVSISAQNLTNTNAGNELTFALQSKMGVIDNFLYENTNTEQTTFVKISPSIRIQTQFSHHLLQLVAKSEHVFYQEFSQDNHSNFSLNPSYQFKLAANKTVFVDALHSEHYETRGTGLSLGNAHSLEVGDTKQDTTIHGGFLYGSENSVAKLSIRLGQEHSRYTTRRAFTKLLDVESSFINPSFDYLIGGGSYFATEVKAEHIVYKYNTALSKNKYVGLVGLKWQPSIITDFTFLLGYQEIQFEQSSLSNDSAIKWRVNVGWQPLEDLAFSLMSERDFAEANKLQDSYRLVDNISLGLRKTWNDYVTLKTTLGYSSEDVFSQTLVSTEEYLTSNITINYQRNTWLSMYVAYDYNDLDTSENDLSYQRNSLSFGFSVTL